MGKIGLILGGLVVALVLSLFGGSFYTVDEGERAVVVSQGKISAIAVPGFHWKTPFIDDAHTVSVRTQAVEFKDEPVYTADRQTATVTFSVNYSAVPADKEITTLYREYQTLDGFESRALKRQVREQIKNVFGTFTADTAIRERGRLNNEVVKTIANLGEGLVKIEGVNIENINFSDAVEAAAEQRAQAEMLVQTEKQKFEREKVLAETQVVQAKAQADSNFALKKAEADGQLAAAKATAEGNRLIGEADAAAIRAKSDALRDSPNLVELTKAQQWNGALPTSMVPGSTIPFMSIK
jgi:regulator of protease activity HflC (stomatin/prohibitin superfamily)